MLPPTPAVIEEVRPWHIGIGHDRGRRKPDSLFPGESHVVRTTATPEDLGRHDDIGSFHIEFFEHAAPEGVKWFERSARTTLQDHGE